MRFLVFLLALLLASPVAAQTMDHSHMDMNMPGMDHGTMEDGSITVADARILTVNGSGTSRLPSDSGEMHGIHIMSGDWMFMLHGYAWGAYTDQGGPRGGKLAFVESMAMAQADHSFNVNTHLQLRAMMSLEPLMGARGYPNLFATGETANNVPLVDRQHPHDLFMELSAKLDEDISVGKVFIYGGPVAEPALGPSAFMHRASAKFNPEAPITHHWFDSTHISYGVVTAGLSTRHWQLEGSAFRGREPDERRWNIETPKLDSYSARLTWNPNAAWSAEISYGRLKSPEARDALVDEERYIASASYASRKGVNITGGVAVKRKLPGRSSTALFAEANYDFHTHQAVFARIESVDNDELFNATPLDPRFGVAYRVSKFTLGYGYTVPIKGPLAVTFGGAASVYTKPAALESAYGTFPVSGVFFVKLSLGR